MVSCRTVRGPIVDSVTSLSLTGITDAVYRGLEDNQIENRKARCHYGVMCRSSYDRLGRATSQERIWCPPEEKWQIDR